MKRILCILLLAVLFLQGSAPVLSAPAENTKLFETVGKAGDNLAVNKVDWELPQGWDLNISNNQATLTSDGTDQEAFCKNVNLSGIWRIFFRLNLTDAGNREAVVSIPLGISAKSSRIAVVFNRHPAGLTSVSVDVKGARRRVLHSGWISGGDRVFDVTISRKSADKNALTLEIYGDNTFVYRETTPDLGVADEVVKGFGFAANQIPLDITGITAGHMPQEGAYLAMAKTAVGDMINNFWTKGPSDGHIKTTWCGYPAESLPDKHGMMWERALMVIPMYSLYRLTLDPVLESRLKAEWAFIQTLFTEEELSAAGSSLHPSVDDSGWSSLGYMYLYQATKDKAALQAAERMTDNAIARWRDNELGGSLWYNNEHSFKSIYQCGILMTLMSLWEIKGTDTAKNKFFDIYNWIENTLRRDDGIYWVNYSANGPDGSSRPYEIKEASSVTCLMANMAMAVINARLYRITGEDMYRVKALATADGMYEHETLNGIYLNDRDAWANGTYAAEWAVQVLTLPGIDKKHREILKKTADSIFAKARTQDGYYGGTWSGPADGLPSKWFSVGSRPQQIMTTGNTVNMLVAAAILEEQERGK